MARYLVQLKDQSVETVAGADAYQQEGQMTTFFRTDSARAVVDSWSTRLFSVRTSEILMIRREDDDVAAAPARRMTRSTAHLQTLRTTG
ncbi:MAG: hypothetical protein QOJ19_3916 [Acidimicrobiia bacterium]|jgi:hypothetical protein|nr:hypothetical protein [Acidimicrobiia bacterium]